MRILFDFELTDLINKWSITNESLNYLQLSLLFLRIKNGQSPTAFKPVFFPPEQIYPSLVIWLKLLLRLHFSVPEWILFQVYW